jgi:hypothetical protein
MHGHGCAGGIGVGLLHTCTSAACIFNVSDERLALGNIILSVRDDQILLDFLRHVHITAFYACGTFVAVWSDPTTQLSRMGRKFVRGGRPRRRVSHAAA